MAGMVSRMTLVALWVALGLHGLGAATPSPSSVGTRLTWEAGSTSLREAIERLSATGNITALPLGVDGTATAEVPAFAGTYWEAVLEVCRRFGLRIVRSPSGVQQRVDPDSVWDYGQQERGRGPILGCRFGSVGLEPLAAGLEPPRYQASGLWLFEVERVRQMEARRLTGTAIWAEFDVVLHCEPRVAFDDVRQVVVGWTGVTAGDREFLLGPPDDLLSREDTPEVDPELQMLRRMKQRAQAQGMNLPPEMLERLREDGGDWHRLVVRGLLPEDRAVTIAGQVQLTGRQCWEAETTLEVDGQGSIQVGTETFDLTLSAAVIEQREDRPPRQRRPALLAIVHEGAPVIPLEERPQVRLVDAFGRAVVPMGDLRQSLGSSRQEYTLYLQQLDRGTHSVYLSGVRDSTVTVDRIGGTVELP